MRQPGSYELYAYWDELRGERTAPERSAIDPSIIQTILADTFILEVDPARTYPFRLPSERLNALFNTQLKGRSFLSLWLEDQRHEIASILEIVTNDAAAIVGGAEVVPIQYEKTHFELLLLPLRHRGKTHARVLGRMASAHQPAWLGLVPADAFAFKSMRVLDTHGLKRSAFQRRLGRSSEMPYEQRGHLRIFTGTNRTSAGGKELLTTLDHDDFGLLQSKIINVIDSKNLERDAGEKPVSTFSHPALAHLEKGHDGPPLSEVRISMNLTPASAENTTDRREYFRAAISVPGRYMLEDRREFPCRTIDFSSNGVSLALPVRGKQGERIVVYLDYIGRIEGTIIRETPLGFALALTYPRAKREKIADQLTYLLNRDFMGRADRRHDRIVPNLRHAMLHLENDKEHLVKLIDVSVSGAAISTQIKLPIGKNVRLGAVSGSIIRTFETGMAIEFTTPLPIEQFDENIRF